MSGHGVLGSVLPADMEACADEYLFQFHADLTVTVASLKDDITKVEAELANRNKTITTGGSKDGN